MAEAVAEAQSVFSDLFGSFDGEDVTPTFASGEIASCEDHGRQSMPSMSGRLDRDDGRGSRLEDAAVVRDRLVDREWVPTRSDRFDDGLSDAGNRWIISAARGELSVRVQLFTTDPFVFVDVWGPCLPNSEEERDLYVGLSPWLLDAAVGAAGPVEPVSVDAVSVAAVNDDDEGDLPTIERMVEETGWKFGDSIDVLESWGMTPQFGHRRIPVCGDGARSQPSVSGLLVQEDERVSTIADAERIRDQLTVSGWEPWQADGFEAGISEIEGRWVVRAQHFDLTIEVAMWPDRSDVVVEVSAPCLPSTDGERTLFEVLGAMQLTNVGPPANGSSVTTTG